MTDKSERQTKVTSSHWGAFEVDVEGNRVVAFKEIDQQLKNWE